MPVFSTRSRAALNSCHVDLQRLFEYVILHHDCTILCGHRGEEEQNRMYAEGKSKLLYPKSKHNTHPSMAVDVVPYPIDWQDLKRFFFFGGFVKSAALHMGIPIRWGGDWNGNHVFDDQHFNDYPHFELIHI